MEKAFKDVGVNVTVKSKTITLSGDTEKFRAEMTNLGGRELKSGDWSFPRKMESALISVLLEAEEKDLRLNSENMSTPEVLAVCKAEDLAIDTGNRESCVKGADESKPYIDPEEISLQIRKELEKSPDLNKVDPRIVYEVVVAYFGADIAPLYETYLPLYQEELEKMKEFLDIPDVEIALLHTYEDSELLEMCSNLGLIFDVGDVESCKVSLLSPESPLGRELRENIGDILDRYEDLEDISIPVVMGEVEKIYGSDFVEGNKSFLVDVIDDEIEHFAEEGGHRLAEMTLPPPKEKKVIKPKGVVKRKKPKDVLKLDKSSRELFENVREGVLTNIITFAPGGVDFLFAESISEKAYADVKDLMLKQDTEDGKTYAIRRHITGKIAGLTDLQLTPDTVVLLGYLFTKKMLYAVTYDSYVEFALQYVKERI